jgi:hypothetical protein
MNRSDAKKPYGVLENRVLAGERKADLYAAYLDNADATRCARVLGGGRGFATVSGCGAIECSTIVWQNEARYPSRV